MSKNSNNQITLTKYKKISFTNNMYIESGANCNVNMTLTPNPVIRYQRKRRSYTLPSGVLRSIPLLMSDCTYNLNFSRVLSRPYQPLLQRRNWRTFALPLPPTVHGHRLHCQFTTVITCRKSFILFVDRRHIHMFFSLSV